MTLKLDSLPYDVLFNIAGRLSFSDVVHLSLACRQLYQLRNERTLCRKTVESHAPFTTEARLAADEKIPYRQALERIYSRRGAFATATPSSACVVDYGSSFLYRQNVLCYMSQGIVRVRSVLDKSLNSTIETEPMAEWLSNHQFGSKDIKPEISLLHYSDHIVSLHFDYSECELCSQWRDDEHWLIYVELDKFSPVTGTGVNVIKPPGSASKLFVRNTATYFFYGTHTGLGAHGHHEWKIHSHSLKEDHPFPTNIPPLQLDEFVGSDLGSTVAFEIHGDHFYAVSNQTSFVVEEVDWTSFYHCIRFPLHRPVKEALEVNTRVYRRQHAEGPINDSWTDLSLQVDERTNDLQIVEARREWRNGGSKQERTFYTREVTFPSKPPGRRQQTANGAVATPSASASAVGSADDGLPEEDTDELDEGATSSARHAQTTPLLPADDLLVSTLGSGNNPHYAPVEERLERSYHPERRHDDGLPAPSQAFILARTKLRAYNLSCSAFLDLVEDDACCPASAAVGGPPCLRLRIGARKRSPYWPLDTCRVSGESEGKGKGRSVAEPARKITPTMPLLSYEDRFVYPHIKLWPPPGETKCGIEGGEHTCTQELHTILNAALEPPAPVMPFVPAAVGASSCGSDSTVTSPTSAFLQMSFSSTLSSCSSATTATTATYTPPPPQTEIVAMSDERSVVFLRRPKYGSGERSGPIVLVSFDRGIEAEALAYTARAERKDSGVALGGLKVEDTMSGVCITGFDKANQMLWKRDDCWDRNCACVGKRACKAC